jgi:teichuronic acid biosynthesis glycosyltransferase TuaC
LDQPVRTLLFSTLYPSSASPLNGIFVETRLRELLSNGGVETKVVAPVPWFPSTAARHGRYADMARTPHRESHHGIDVLHPRYLVIPKIGMNLTPFFLALSARNSIALLLKEGFDFDVIDAHYYYPDGVAAALLAAHFRKRLTITARGTDLNLIPDHWWPRKLMQWAARRADASIGVCDALMDVLRGWRIDPQKLHVMRNGVDLQRFRPLPQDSVRTELGVRGQPLLLSVGHMTERKGHHIAIDALAALSAKYPEARLLVVGDGEERQRLKAQAERLGVHDRVTFAGAVPNAELLRWYSAADVLLLGSSREGWPNVLLESMACGTPVVATAIWGTPEVVQSPTAGRLVSERDGRALAAGVQDLIEAGIDRQAVRVYAEGFSWSRTSEDQLALFKRLAAQA